GSAEAEIGLLRPAEILRDGARVEAAGGDAVEPIGQRVAVPGDDDIVPIAVLDVAEIDDRRERQSGQVVGEIRVVVGDLAGVVGVVEGIELDPEAIGYLAGAEGTAAGSERKAAARIVVEDERDAVGTGLVLFAEIELE